MSVLVGSQRYYLYLYLNMASRVEMFNKTPDYRILGEIALWIRPKLVTTDPPLKRRTPLVDQDVAPCPPRV